MNFSLDLMFRIAKLACIYLFNLKPLDFYVNYSTVLCGSLALLCQILGTIIVVFSPETLGFLCKVFSMLNLSDLVNFPQILFCLYICCLLSYREPTIFGLQLV